MIFKFFWLRGDLDRLGLDGHREWSNGRVGFLVILVQDFQDLGLLGHLFDLLLRGSLLERRWEVVKPLVEVCDRAAMYASGVNVDEILKTQS